MSISKYGVLTQNAEQKKNMYTLRMTQTCKLCTIGVRFCTPMEPIITKPSLVHDFEILVLF